MGESTQDLARSHAWEYFALHAGQRMALFNYFTAFVGLLAAGIGVGFDRLPGASLALGLLLSLVSLTFAKLDARVSLLIKHAEKAIIALSR